MDFYFFSIIYATVRYSYDANGNLTSITPPGSATHLFNYDAVSLPSKYTPPALGTASVATIYQYNLAKQLTNITRPDTKTVALTYDSGARLSTITIPRGIYKFDYDLVTGNLVTVTSPDTSNISYIYDGSLMTEEKSTGMVNGIVTRTFDNNYRITSRSVNRTSITYTYDKDTLLTGAGSESLVRDSLNGLLTGTTLDTITTTRAYNLFGEPQSVSATSSGTTNLYNTSYTRDAVGRITTKSETVQGVSNTYVYGYDAVGRLISVDENGTQVSSYSYDSNGNRLTHNTTKGSYDAQDRLLTYGAVKYTYTNNGELLTKSENTVTTNYQYDVLGNLIQVALPGTTTIDYVIDALNRRVGKKVNGALIQGLLYKDQLNPIAELDGTGAVVSRFVYGSKINVPDYMIKGGVTYRILSDHLGSPRLIVDSLNGNVVQRIDYDEFGTIINDTNPGFQPFGFAGGLYDSQTKLTRFGVRDYDAFTGRWTNKDPIRFNGGINLYGYTNNDPINMVDFNGENPFAIAGGIIGATLNAIGNYQAYASGQISGSEYAKSIAVGGLTGILSGFGVGVIGNIVVGAATSTANTYINDLLLGPTNCGPNNNVTQAAKAGAVAGGVAGVGAEVGGMFARPIMNTPFNLAGKPFSGLGGAVGFALGTVAGVVIGQ